MALPIKAGIEKVPGGLMLVPMLAGAVVHTAAPDSGEFFGSFTGALYTGMPAILAVFELMADPAYFPLERRIAVATEEIREAEQITGHPVMYAFSITGDLAGLRRRHDMVVEAGGRCVMLNVPVMGLPALARLRDFSEVPVHGHRAGPAGSMRSPALGMSYRVWQQLARPAGADHLHVSGFGSKFYETDAEVAANTHSLLEPLGRTLRPGAFGSVA